MSIRRGRSQIALFAALGCGFVGTLTWAAYRPTRTSWRRPVAPRAVAASPRDLSEASPFDRLAREPAVYFRVNFRGHFFSGEWSDTHFWKCDFRGADLSGVDFRAGGLRGVELRSCQFTQCDFRGADLRGGDLAASGVWGCDLRRARLHHANLHGVLYDRHTRWPEAFDPQHAGARLVGPNRPPIMKMGDGPPLP